MYTIFVLGGTLFSIHVLSTIPERLCIFAVVFVILHQLSARLAVTKKKKLVSAAVAGIITLLMVLHLGSTILRFKPVIFAVIALMLFLMSTRLVLTKNKKVVSAVIAGIIALLINSADLTDIHRTLFADPAVTKFAEGHFNGLGLNKDDHTLYVIGDGVNNIHAYNINALSAPPKLSELKTGRAEVFLYNDRAKEIYTIPKVRESNWAQQLNILDATTLTLKESIPIQFPQGVSDDAWIGLDPQTGYIIVAAEAKDKQLDKATVIINRKEGKVVKDIPLAPMNMLLHPSRPMVYLGFFQDSNSNEIISYDLEALAFVNKTQIDARLDRMAYLEAANELLVTAPAKSLIYRLDGDTLEVKGQIPSTFGVRTLIVDAKRNLLLTLSLVTNNLDVIDLNTHKSIKRFYLSPWLRSIVLDGEGTAYVSSFTGLFRVAYAQKKDA